MKKENQFRQFFFFFLKEEKSFFPEIVYYPKRNTKRRGKNFEHLYISKEDLLNETKKKENRLMKIMSKRKFYNKIFLSKRN